MSEMEHPLFNEEGKVICQLCGKAYLVITPKHTGTHSISYSEYRLRFPDAPLSSKEFNAMSTHGKEKTIFVKQEMEKLDKEESKIKDLLLNDEIPDKDVDPIIDEEINFDQIYKEAPQKDKDVFAISKNRILDHLKSHFTNIKKDHMIQVFNLQNLMVFETISDFADPVLKIDFEFPRAFWHNRMSYDDPTRNDKLSQYGWKVVEIKSKAPTYDDIKNILNSL